MKKIRPSLALIILLTSQHTMRSEELPLGFQTTSRLDVSFGAKWALPKAGEVAISVPVPDPTKPRPKAYPQPQLLFEPNVGQFDPETKFVARGPGYLVFLTPTEAMILLSADDWQWGDRSSGIASGPVSSRAGASPEGSLPSTQACAGTRGVPQSIPSTNPNMLRMSLVGADPCVRIRGEKQLPGKLNYFIGHDPNQWRTNVPTFSQVRLENVYPGIDLIYYGKDGQLEFDFVVAPGANPGQARLALDGADQVHLDPSGDLIVQSKDRKVRLAKPLAYQHINGLKHEVSCIYHPASFVEPTEHSAWLTSFSLTAYDSSQPLVIDPALTYGTFLGGSNRNSRAYGVAVDRDGAAYITGSTTFAGFPTKNPFQLKLNGPSDAFVTKLDSAGQLVYSTYIGGSNTEEGRSIAVDSFGNACVVGRTFSSDFPIKNAVQSIFAGGPGIRAFDAFVLKLGLDGGSLIYSTYLGGSDMDLASGVAVDPAGDAYVCGLTASLDFPVTNAVQPQYGGGPATGFITKLSPAGAQLLYSTYLGGSGDDEINAIAVDDQGNAWVGGWTQSTNFPTRDPFQSEHAGGTWDAFLTRLAPEGKELSFSSYFGGTKYESINGIAVGRNGDIYFAGETGSADLLTTNAFQPQNPATPDSDGVAQCTFVARYNPSSKRLVFSSYLGGSGSAGTFGTVSGDFAKALVLDAADNVYLAGGTAASDFPTTPDAFQGSFAGGLTDFGALNDGFLSVLSSDGTKLFYSTYLGGSGSEEIDAVALDAAGNMLLAGSTWSSDFPVPNPILPFQSGQFDSVFVARFTPIVGLPVLKAALVGGDLSISWPSGAAGFTLESSDSLSLSAKWSLATNAPVIIGDQQIVLIPADRAMKFFRLYKP